jgi:hypothetical protein
MKFAAAASIGIFCFLFCIFLLLEAYKTPLPENSRVEMWRYTTDRALQRGIEQKNPFTFWLNRMVFRNSDKPVFRPPRILRVSDTNNKTTGYQFFGVVSAWDPNTKLLTLNSYLGQPVVVRFDPTRDGSYAYFPVLDTRGVMDETKPLLFVGSTAHSAFPTLFCTGDIMSIETASWLRIMYSSQFYPVIPKLIMLSHHICSTNP